ncbi:septum formation inhibitor-activating ATPase [Sphingomonas sp. MMS12-HWE2-04]|uniref:septum formation inhibitor-activating ATPase n=1 Tax=Sphingomonas sp. MMS12-HWE2-04 TaxID=3234199 RepID=UPI0038507C92
MPARLEELLDNARAASGPQIVAKIGIGQGGVDPLGLRQINFGLMDRVFPDLNNVARHVRPYIVMAWAWRQVRRILEGGKKAGALDEEMRDFVDRIEAIYAWSQFLIDPRADLPGAVAMRKLFEVSRYTFGGQEWERRRDTRRYSTGLISPLNYGPSLQTMGWLERAEEGAGVFITPPDLDPVLDAFEARLAGELDHPAFSRLGSVTVKSADVARWGRLWSIKKPSALERKALFERLGGALAPVTRRRGIALIQAGYNDLHEEDWDIDGVRARMADRPDAWGNPASCPAAATEWRAVQVRQVFRLTLEALLYWFVEQLGDGPMHTGSVAGAFLNELGRKKLPTTADAWILTAVPSNPVHLLNILQAALKSRQGLATAIVAGLRHSLAEAPDEAHEFETFDRLPSARARAEASAWRTLSPHEIMVRILETWVMAQHTYWCVTRGLNDARGRGKTILRLRIVMDEGGWTQTPGTTLGSPPEATPDRLETAFSLLEECRQL